MGLVLFQGPQAEPVSLAEAKKHCRVDVTDDDGLIAGYILAARTFAEDYTRRAFMTQTWDYTIDYQWPSEKVRGYKCLRITLPKPKLQSVTSIQYVDQNGLTQTLGVDKYVVDTGSWQGVIDPEYLAVWPILRPTLKAITIRMVCGYGSNPGDGQYLEMVRQAMLLIVGHWYENRETVNIGNIVNKIPMTAESLLFPLRVFY